MILLLSSSPGEGERKSRILKVSLVTPNSLFLHVDLDLLDHPDLGLLKAYDSPLVD